MRLAGAQHDGAVVCQTDNGAVAERLIVRQRKGAVPTGVRGDANPLSRQVIFGLVKVLLGLAVAHLIRPFS